VAELEFELRPVSPENPCSLLSQGLSSLNYLYTALTMFAITKILFAKYVS
jgi:hypothetical protein